MPASTSSAAVAVGLHLSMTRCPQKNLAGCIQSTENTDRAGRANTHIDGDTRIKGADTRVVFMREISNKKLAYRNLKFEKNYYCGERVR